VRASVRQRGPSQAQRLASTTKQDYCSETLRADDARGYQGAGVLLVRTAANKQVEVLVAGEREGGGQVSLICAPREEEAHDAEKQALGYVWTGIRSFREGTGAALPWDAYELLVSHLTTVVWLAERRFALCVLHADRPTLSAPLRAQLAGLGRSASDGTGNAEAPTTGRPVAWLPVAEALGKGHPWLVQVGYGIWHIRLS
jgi:hypothetical protein